MNKTKSKRQIPSHSNRNKTARQSKAAPARQATVRMPHAPLTVGQRHQSSSRQPGRPQSKQAQIIAMLQAPAGATIDAMMQPRHLLFAKADCSGSGDLTGGASDLGV